MSRELISKATRNEFREVLAGFMLREIDMMFDSAGLRPKAEYVPPVVGQRRGLVEQYYANLDFANPAHIRKLLNVYEELIQRLETPDVANPKDVHTTISGLLRRMERDGFPHNGDRFVSGALLSAAIHAPTLVGLTEVSITEHVEKARLKIENGDHAGAIASAYTLVEGFLKELLRRTGTPFKEDEGDIRELYKLVARPLNLSPGGESLESYLKAILQGLRQQVAGFYELANKASDRHTRRYNPARHHAKLAVNATFSLCEFLLDSFEYQTERKERKGGS
jgi:Abortive infection C-terminus